MPPETYPETLPRARRRALGAFYTPDWIVSAVVDETLARAPAGPLRVLDPACGDGRFLAACVARLGARAVRVLGVERDPEAAARARAALGAAAEIRVAEALMSGAAPDGAWDVVVGNPPWLRSVALKADDPALWARLRGRYAATSYKEWDLYGAFIEQALAWVAPGGAIGLVTPSRWLTAAFAEKLRVRVAPHVRRVVDLGDRQVFDGATTYTALVFLQGTGAEVELVRDGQTTRAPAGTWTVGPSLRDVGPPLGAIARIAKGAGTNADPVFLLEPRDGGIWSHALASFVEVDGLVPCLRGRDVGSYAATVRRLALLPYDGAGRLVPLPALPASARAYLERCRPLLEARERGRFRGERFHAWGRPQNLQWLRDPAPKVVVPDAAAAGRATLDAGTLVIDTAYAVRPLADAPLGLLLAVLNHDVVATWLRAHGIPLRGGYFRMKTAYLASLPVPDPRSPAARLVAELALAGRTDEARNRLTDLYS